MRIGMILERVFPSDIRVEKEARHLIENGHEVFLLSLWKKDLPINEQIDNIHISRIKIENNIINRIINYLDFSLFFIQPAMQKNIDFFVRQNKIDILHVHDLPLVKSALTVAKKNSIPLIADLHENYPEALREWRKEPRPWYSKTMEYFLSPSRFEQMSKSTLPEVSHIISVIDEGKTYYSKEYRIPENNITVVMNAEDLGYYDSIPIHFDILKKYKTNFVISYIGGFGPHRGIDTAIRMMAEVIKVIPTAKLILVGAGSPAFDTTIRTLCKEMNVENNIDFTGWVDFSLVPSYIAASSVCLVPHHASGHTNSTIPHKLFQYMAMKKPIVTTDCVPLKRIVEETHSGIVVPSGNSEAMTEAIIRIYNNPISRSSVWG